MSCKSKLFKRFLNPFTVEEITIDSGSKFQTEITQRKISVSITIGFVLHLKIKLLRQRIYLGSEQEKTSSK